MALQRFHLLVDAGRAAQLRRERHHLQPAQRARALQRDAEQRGIGWVRKGDDVASITDERAAELLADRRARGPVKKKATKKATKKAPAKKKAAKKS